MKNSFFTNFIIVIAGLLYFSCEGTNIEPAEFGENEIARLLTGQDTAKVWQRINRTEDNQQVSLSGCETSHHLLFGFESSAKTDTLFLSYNSKNENCNDSTVLFKGKWNVRESFQKDSLIWLNEQDTLYHIIDDITSIFLELSFQENGKKVKETYRSSNN